MALSDELISLFVKTTKDDKKTPTEATVFGTIVVDSGIKYVQLDGSDELTPISTTTNAIAGEKVVVRIKNHSATVIGNITSPSATSKDVNDIVDNFEYDLDVERAKIAKLDGNIAEFDKLYAKEAAFTELKADVAAFKDLQVDNFEATNAEIDNLKTTKLDVSSAEAEYAKIKALNATDANVGTLKADVGKIDTLVSDFVSGGSVQTQFANAVIAQLGEAWIKSAMIDAISANKITSGDIITDNIKVRSEDGSLLISDAMIQIKDSNQEVRIQIGKDASGNYTINICDSDGNLIFSEGGITEHAVKEAIIRDDMVAPIDPDSDYKGISASKLNIDSLFNVINDEENTNTIKSSKVLIDDEGQTLMVAFGEMTTKVDDAQSAIDNLKIGATNLLRNSNFANSINSLPYYWVNQGMAVFKVMSENGSTYLHIANEGIEGSSTNRIHNNTTEFEHVAGETYSLSFDARSSTNGTRLRSTVAAQTNANDYTLTTNWTRYSFTYTSEITGSVTFWIREAEADVDITNIKLEKGTVATDWSPSPKDISSDITALGTELSAVQGLIESKIWKTDITEEVNNINVGRNYFARCNINNLACVSSKLVTGDDYRGYSIAVNPGENWTLYRTDVTNNRWRVYFTDVEPSNGVDADYVALNDDDQAANTVNYFAVPDSMTWMFIYLSDQGDVIPDIMLEKGNKASTDWIPAPEDMKSDISTLSTQYSEIRQDLNGVSATVASHETTILTKADSSKVAEVSDKLAELELNHDEFKVSVKETYATKDEIDNRNLIRNSNFAVFQETFPHWTNEGMNAFEPLVEANTTYAHIESASIGSAGCRIYQNTDSFTHSANTTYTLSFAARSSAEGTVLVSCVAGEHNKKEYVLTTELTRYFYTYTPTTTGSLTFWLRDANTKADITNIKLEKGSTATDWSLSPEDIVSDADVNMFNKGLADVQDDISDVTSRVSKAEALLQVLSDSVLTVVTDEESGSVSIQNKDGWMFSTSELLEALQLTNSTVEGLNTNLSNINDLVGVLNNDLTALAGYIQLHPDGDAPYIEIGKFGNSFKLRITNSAILFKDDEAIPAHIDNKSLHIQKAVVDNELQIGGYVWKKRSNGNVGLVWKGVV
jgi:hypothetical protein